MQPNAQHKHLAWHETMELHELTASQSNTLMGLKMHVHDVADPKLRGLYEETIRSTESNLKELLQFYPMAPMEARNNKSKPHHEDLTAFYLRPSARDSQKLRQKLRGSRYGGSYSAA